MADRLQDPGRAGGDPEHPQRGAPARGGDHARITRQAVGLWVLDTLLKAALILFWNAVFTALLKFCGW